MAKSLYEHLQEVGLVEAEPVQVSCAHVTRGGKRCENDPVEGDTMCVVHGGSIINAKESAQRRLIELQRRSLDTAEVLLSNADDRVKATVMIAIWDRTGLSPKTAQPVDPADDDSNRVSDEEWATRLEEHAAKLRKASSTRGTMDRATVIAPGSDKTH